MLINSQIFLCTVNFLICNCPTGICLNARSNKMRVLHNWSDAVRMTHSFRSRWRSNAKPSKRWLALSKPFHQDIYQSICFIKSVVAKQTQDCCLDLTGNVSSRHNMALYGLWYKHYAEPLNFRTWTVRWILQFIQSSLKFITRIQLLYLVTLLQMEIFSCWYVVFPMCDTQIPVTMHQIYHSNLCTLSSFSWDSPSLFHCARRMSKIASGLTTRTVTVSNTPSTSI